MVNDLFNPKTVKRLCSNVKLSTQQKNAAQEWMELLEQGKLEKERPNYLKFVKIVLNDLLGYELKEILHEEENIEFSFKDVSGRKVLGIEVKGTGTKDLFAKQKGREEQETAIQQLWRYMGGSNFDYGIVTNYKEFILIDRLKGTSRYHIVDFEEIKNNEQKLKEFVAIFSKEQIIDNRFIEELGEASEIEERNFTKEFYKLFHETRLMLIKEFEENGASRDESIHYAQLFLNRLMFVFFAEDTGKLERRLFENLVVSALNAEMLISDHSRLISNKIVDLFRSLDEGATTPTKIFGFNGGLFKEKVPPRIYFKDMRDERFFKNIYQYSKLKKEYELDAISKPIFIRYKNKLNPIIKNLLIMVFFDFNTEISINILGHIFEQSLTDLEDLREGKARKRKKEGIYYTPDYVTRHICEKTIIPYLSEKGAKTSRELVLEYANNIQKLEKKFSDIKILDPACGSGAFLIQAVDVLLEIHKEIQIFKQNKGEYTAVKRGRKRKKDEGQLTLIKWKEEDEARDIIENNIFGVDINEESVEITKLSLFLKIVRKHKKLIDLSQNIQCGNSLVDDSSVDPNAFIWEKRFNRIMDAGGFDIVIGNPPYVNFANLPKDLRAYFSKKYGVYKNKTDLYAFFIERANTLLGPRGELSFIIPHTWLGTTSFHPLRKLLLDELHLKSIVNLGFGVFQDSVVKTVIISAGRTSSNSIKIYDKNFNSITTIPMAIIRNDPENMINLSWTKQKQLIFDKISHNSERLDTVIRFTRGIKTSNDGRFIKNSSENSDCKRVIRGRNIKAYAINFQDEYVWYRPDLMKEKVGSLPHTTQLFEVPRKLITQRVNSSGELLVAYDDEQYFTLDTTNVSVSDNKKDQSLKYILTLLNSRLINWWFSERFKVPTISGYELHQIPLKLLSSDDQKPFVNKANQMLKLHKEFNNKKAKFFNRVKQNLNLKKITKRLDNFFELSFKEFCGEMGRQKIKLSIKQQDEWEDYFNKYKTELLELWTKIVATDKEIDEMVYNIYGITKKEENLIEESLK